MRNRMTSSSFWFITGSSCSQEAHTGRLAVGVDRELQDAAIIAFHRDGLVLLGVLVEGRSDARHRNRALLREGSNDCLFER